MRQFLVESLLLCGIGGVLGVLLACGSKGMVVQFAATYVPRTKEVALDARVLAASLVLVVLTGLAVGLFPALQVLRGSLANPLKDGGNGASGGRRGQRVRSVLVGFEVALAMILLGAAGLLARSLVALQHADQGFDPHGVYISGFGIGGRNYNTREKRQAFSGVVLNRLAALPGVQNVAFANALPSMGVPGLLFHVVGTPEVPVKDAPHLQQFVVSSDYFKAMGIPLLRGRGFDAQDQSGPARVVMISQEFARRYFSGVDPIGRRLMIMTMADTPDVVREIVGVVGDVRATGPQGDLNAQVYEPIGQFPFYAAMLVVKASGASRAVPALVGDVMKTLDPDLPFRDLRPYESVLEHSWFRQRFSLILIGVFSLVALVLAGIGIYGVMNYAVRQRMREIGIRLALGATGRDVVTLIFRNAVRIVVLGVGFGAVGTIVFARVLDSLLYGVNESDPLNLGLVSLLLAVVALVACALPAWRATQVNPIATLRND